MTKIIVDARGVPYVEDADENTLGNLPRGWALCLTCKRAWDDSKSTSVTPTPAGRCPFEDEHEAADEQQDVVLDPGAAEHLAREIRHSLASVEGSLIKRSRHPSYGVTKGQLRDRPRAGRGRAGRVRAAAGPRRTTCRSSSPAWRRSASPSSTRGSATASDRQDETPRGVHGYGPC